MKLNSYKQVFFIGIGGIGMSALARYFKMKGVEVGGYDRTASQLTEELQKEGISIVFSDEEKLIDEKFKNSKTTLVVFTPAVPNTHRQLNYFKNNGFTVKKRSEVLGLISGEYQSICVAGTHGKTTISGLTSHIFKNSSLGCMAFLGGISKNYNTNFLWTENTNYAIMEADEFDRSFLQLKPFTALISSVDADHLDIYESKEKVHEAYKKFAESVPSDCALIIKHGLPVDFKLQKYVRCFTYSITDKNADFFGSNVIRRNNRFAFTLKTPYSKINLEINLPGLINIENAVAACALALANGVEEEELKKALSSFQGMERRFDTQINTQTLVYIDDYAHHPEEIKATLSSIRKMYFGYKITVIFQPHLYSRTRDFHKEFAQALSLADNLILLDIYPAREEPIAGVSSKMIGDLVNKIPVQYCQKNEIVDNISLKRHHVVVTMGAGDIDREVKIIKEKLQEK